MLFFQMHPIEKTIKLSCPIVSWFLEQCLSARQSTITDVTPREWRIEQQDVNFAVLFGLGIG
jgi:hypothetical protein